MALSYYNALGSDLELKSVERDRQFTLIGNYLAGRVVDEIGPRREVYFRTGLTSGGKGYVGS